MTKIIITKKDLDNVVAIIDWLNENPQFFNCDCEPAYEADTNATIHDGCCSSLMDGHVDITLDNLEQAATQALPAIVCLCGSTRFWRTFQQAGLQETLAGNIVLSIGAASGTDDDHFGNLPREEYDRVKVQLDQLHLRKIDLADEVLILNIGGYIGDSTKRELLYARRMGKPIRFWEDWRNYRLRTIVGMRNAAGDYWHLEQSALSEPGYTDELGETLFRFPNGLEIPLLSALDRHTFEVVAVAVDEAGETHDIAPLNWLLSPAQPAAYIKPDSLLQRPTGQEIYLSDAALASPTPAGEYCIEVKTAAINADLVFILRPVNDRAKEQAQGHLGKIRKSTRYDVVGYVYENQVHQAFWADEIEEGNS